MKTKITSQKQQVWFLVMIVILMAFGKTHAQQHAFHSSKQVLNNSDYFHSNQVLVENKQSEIFQMVSDTVVLFDNGPIVTDSGGGPGGSNLSVLQNVTLGMSYPGFSAGILQNKRVSDDFVVTGYWRVSSFEFYVYQTGSSENSTITQMNLRIWDGPPDNSESEIIWGDDNTNVLSSTSWTNSYRVSESMPLLTNRPIMSVKVNVPDLVFISGTYWLDVQFGGTLSTEPSVIPVTIIDSVNTGNAKQLNSGFWEEIIDIGQQGIPFRIKGELVDCNPPTFLTGISVYYGQDNYGAEICWNSGINGGNISEWLYYDDGVNVDGIGGETNFMWAIKFDPTQLADFDGTSLTKIKFYNCTEAANELRIYEGTNAATLLHIQTLSGLPIESWNEVTLSSPIFLDVTKQLWVAIYTEDGLQSPAACGVGMGEPNGDLISMDEGLTWEHLINYNMDYTWNLRAYVTNIAGTTVSLTSVNENVNSNYTKSETRAISSIVSLSKTNLMTSKVNRQTSSFNIYRRNDYNNDYVLIANVPEIQGTSHYCYQDFPEFGFYFYQVTTLCIDSLGQECESIPAWSLIFPNNNYVYMYIGPVGIGELDSKSLLLYPNPSSESVTIESKKMNRISVTNTLGQQVYDSVIQDADKVILNVKSCETGVYVVRVETANTIVSERMTIIH